MKVSFIAKLKTTALISVLSLFSGLLNANSDLESRIKRLEESAESRGQLQADMVFQLNAIQQELQQLRGKMEEQEYQLKQLQDRQRDLYRDIERRLSQLQSAPPTSRPTQTGTTESTTTAQRPISKKDVHSDYQQIFELVRGRKYDEAIQAYQGFLTTYPNSQYEPNVYYWMGQIHFIQQNFDDAMKEFKVVTSRFSDSTRASDALFKQGKILLMQNQIEQAKAIFNEVIDKYDGTAEQLAKKELDAIR